MTPQQNTSRIFSVLAWIAFGLLTGLAASKYSARIAYETGYSVAHQEITREAHCVSWWFNDSAQRIREAKFYACQR